MKERRIMDWLICICSAIVFVMSLLMLEGSLRLVSCSAGGILFIVFLVVLSRKESIKQQAGKQEELPEEIALTTEGITELALLNEDDQIIAAWEMYGRASLVIGRDIGENQVSVNLNEASFASMIDKEHAVLNYSGGQWYIEDLGSKNGISVIKSDGRKYRLAPDKPCLLAVGDILCIAMTKLLLR